MDSEQLLREIEALPDADRRQVADFIAFLRFRAKQDRRRRRPRRWPLTDDPFIGMWKDREDMQDSVDCVRSIRGRESTRR